MSLTAAPPPVNPSVRHRSTRDRPAKAPLSEDAVVDAALAILKSDGLEAVTMRRVAAAVDTGAASLYVYVSGREGLLRRCSIVSPPPSSSKPRTLHIGLLSCTRCFSACAKHWSRILESPR